MAVSVLNYLGDWLINTGNGYIGIYILSMSNFLLENVTSTDEVYRVIFNIILVQHFSVQANLCHEVPDLELMRRCLMFPASSVSFTQAVHM